MSNPRSWSIGGRELALDRPLVMGVLNVTPDSFYDGGRYSSDVQGAVDHAVGMIEAGADIVDVGGESSRPGSERMTEERELERVMPVIEGLAAKRPDAVVSIDTWKARVARSALAAGARIVNDISAGRLDDQLLPAVAECGCGYVLMHMQGSPETMQIDPQYGDVVSDIREFFEEHVAALRALGVNEQRIVLDPGIGFGKRLEHNLRLIADAEKLRVNELPLLFGVSRKSFLGSLLGRESEERLNGTTAAHMMLLMQGVDILRVHDVPAAVDAVKLFLALREVEGGN